MGSTGMSCVKIITKPANYLQALQDCQTRGAELASVHSEEEMAKIHSLTGTKGAWIGLTDFLDEETFSWVDGSPLNFTAWGGGEPNNHNNNQHCTWIRPDGQWDDLTCKDQKQYVCQKPFIEIILG